MDSPERIVAHTRILARKPLIRSVFLEFYDTCRQLDDAYFGSTPGLRVELGAGVSLFKNRYPDILATDIVPADHLDAVVDAQATQFADGSVRALYGINCFHHFPEKRKFFREMTRIIQPGGGAILIEPYYGAVAAALFKRLFASETFDAGARDWDDNHVGAMVGANQAASYMVFVRDRALFESEFPSLEVAHMAPLSSYVRYLLSGGLNFRSLVPGVAEPLLRLGESALTPLHRMLALHHVVVLRRR